MEQRRGWLVRALWVLALAGCDLSPDVGNDKEEKEGSLSAECAVSTDCQEAVEVCDSELGKCVKPRAATCPGGEHGECARFEGLPVCLDGRCVAPECSQDDDCQSISPTASCDQGRCVDKIWGCGGEPEERPFTSEPGTYRVKVIDVLTAAIPPDLTITLCRNGCSTNALNCETQPGAKVSVDTENDMVVIKNLPSTASIHLQMHAAGTFDTEFHSQRPMRGDTEELAAINLIPKALIPILQNATDIPVDTENNATFIGRLFDCENKLAAGIQLSVSRLKTDSNGGTDTRVFYLEEGGLPAPDTTLTDDYGGAGIVNLSGDKQTTMTMTFAGYEVGAIVLIPKTGWITYAHLFASDYWR